MPKKQAEKVDADKEPREAPLTDDQLKQVAGGRKAGGKQEDFGP